ncbi:MarR family winged helix-turn-helix transcriptional regulator [Lacticaseibacillus daqingensis]|uniref:MarR family winged helix-turn-helix transcriptional regulator n=1 Tax=Lacticaseibacillus daqingensis TaxID=2486014 RepID=UPI000F7AD99B|nr:MarR family transcriptional regulator [Lacticaseibacillus daqingensis]
MPDLGYLLLNQAKRLKAAQQRALGVSHITVSQWALLAALSRAGAATAAELATALDMDRPTVSGIVGRLVAKDLLVETPVAGDRRARLLTMTAAGTATFAQCAQLADQTSAAYLAPLTAAQQQTLLTLLTQLEEGHRND